MDRILKEELLRSVGIFPFIFAATGWWYFNTDQSFSVYLVPVISLVITVLTIPFRVWYRRKDQ